MTKKRFQQTWKLKILSLIGKGVCSCMLQCHSALNNDIDCQDVNHGRKHVLWLLVS